MGVILSVFVATDSWAQTLTAAVLPSSRSVQVGVPASAFATIINTGSAPIIPGLNTLLLSAENRPVPDIIALAATLTNDGIVNIAGTTGTGVFSVATVNVGASGMITASADTGGASLPIGLTICQTNSTTGACLSPPAASVTTQIGAQATPTFGIFIAGRGKVPFDPGTNRITVRFKDAGGVARGATSTAAWAPSGFDPSPLFQSPDLQDAGGKTVFRSDGTFDPNRGFRPGQKNVLIIHGWNQSPSDACLKQLISFADGPYDNVLVYQYPSADPISKSARWPNDHLLPMVLNSDLKFDILGYSEGGLVGRAAKESNGNQGFGSGNRVENLVTIGTPHNGLIDAITFLQATGTTDLLFGGRPTPGLNDMLKGSLFLDSLKTGAAQQRQGSTRYLTITGQRFGQTDGAVEVDSAHGSGVLLTAGQATFNLTHAPPLGTPTMPCDQQVFDQINTWIFGGPSSRDFSGT